MMVTFSGGSNDGKGSPRSSGVLELFCIFNRVVITWVHVFVKTQTVYLKDLSTSLHVHFISVTISKRNHLLVTFFKLPFLSTN